MEIEHIKEFLVLSAVLNYENAADILYISQSSLFKHIKTLESDIGAELFKKSGKRIYLTTEGEKLIDYAKQFESLDENYRRDIVSDDSKGQGNVRFYAERPYMDLVIDFNRKYPSIRLDSFYGEEGMDGAKALSTGEANVALIEKIEGMDDSIEVIPFESRPLSLLVYDSHPLSNRKLVDIAELKDERFVSFAMVPNSDDRFKRLFNEAHFEPHIVITATSNESLQRMVREKLGIALVFENSIDYHVNGLKLINLKQLVNRNSYLCYKKSDKHSEAVETFIAFLKNKARWDGKDI